MAPGPGRRLGPRPLPLHLMLAMLPWSSSIAGYMSWKAGWRPSKPAPAALEQGLAAADPAAMMAALEREARRRAGRLLTGLNAYRQNPAVRDLPPAPCVWAEGTTRLLDHGGGGRPLLLVPSLVNRAYILDLSADTSLCRFLAAAGFRVFLLDWDAPGPEERGFDLTAYVAGRLESALGAVLRLAGAPPVLLGYCMGGLLALALATRRPDAVAGLALLATPFDFHAPDPLPPRRLADAMAPLLPWLPLWGGLPVDLIQSLFALVDPRDSTAKFSRFADLDPDSDRARAFVLLEDWLNDGVPLAPAVAAECLSGWYGGNDPAAGRWRIAGRPVRPADWRGPSLALVPARDRIVPPESALALAHALPNCEILAPPLGHIGMIVSGAAPDKAWAPLRDWLRRL